MWLQVQPKELTLRMPACAVLLAAAVFVGLLVIRHWEV